MTEQTIAILDSRVRDFIKEKLVTISISKDKQVKVSPKSQEKFYRFCIQKRVNPYRGEVYAMPFWNNDTKNYDVMPVIDYKVYMKWANTSGKM